MSSSKGSSRKEGQQVSTLSRSQFLSKAPQQQLLIFIKRGEMVRGIRSPKWATLKKIKIYTTVDEKNRRTVQGRSGQRYTSSRVASSASGKMPLSLHLLRLLVLNQHDNPSSHPVHLFVHFLPSYFPHQSLEFPRKTCQQCKVFCGNQKWVDCCYSKQAQQSYELQKEMTLSLSSCWCQLWELPSFHLESP